MKDRQHCENRLYAASPAPADAPSLTWLSLITKFAASAPKADLMALDSLMSPKGG